MKPTPIEIARRNQKAARRKQLLELLGFIALVIGVWLWSEPAGLVVLGLGLIAAANAPSSDKDIP